MFPDHRPKPPPDPMRQWSQPIVRLGDAEIIPPPGHEPVQFTDDLPDAAPVAPDRYFRDPFFEPLYRLPVKADFRILSCLATATDRGLHPVLRTRPDRTAPQTRLPSTSRCGHTCMYFDPRFCLRLPSGVHCCTTLAFGYPSPPFGWVWTLTRISVIILPINS
jgi:hypothetical protein